MPVAGLIPVIVDIAANARSCRKGNCRLIGREFMAPVGGVGGRRTSRKEGKDLSR